MNDDLLDAVLRQPDSDALRLVHADSLIERGDPRGELIVVQCRLATMSPRAAEYAQAYAKAARLLLAFQDRWTRRLETIVQDPWVRFVFRRGFVESVRMSVTRLSTLGAEIAARTPLKSACVVHEGDDTRPPRRPAIPGLRALRIEGATRQRNIVPLLESSWLDGLTSLEIHEARISRRIGMLVDRAPSSLRKLSIQGAQVQDRGMATLLNAPWIGDLQVLGVGGNDITVESLGMLFDGRLRSLHTLSLAWSPNLMWRWAPYVSRLPALRALDVRESVFGDDLRALLKQETFTRMEELGLSTMKGELDAKLAATIADAGLQELYSLDVSRSALRADGVTALGPLLGKLVRLHVARSNLGDAGVEALIEAMPSSRLVELCLDDNHITDRGVTALAQWPGLENVVRLSLHQNHDISNVGLRALAESKYLHPYCLRLPFSLGTVGLRGMDGMLRERFGRALDVEELHEVHGAGFFDEDWSIWRLKAARASGSGGAG